MSATLTRASLDSYPSLNVQNSNSATSTVISNHNLSTDSDNGVDFAKALSILSSSAAQGMNSVYNDTLSADTDVLSSDDSFLSDCGASFKRIISEDSEDKAGTVRSSLEERFSVLNNSPKKEEWELLEKRPDEQDYSVLSKLGDGLLAAAKLAAGAYLGKVI